MQEFRGELIRDVGGFALAANDGRVYPLELPRVPVDLFGKNVVVTGEKQADVIDRIVAHHIRGQDQ